MKIANRIANEIMTKLESDGVLKTNIKNHFYTECLIADTLTEGLSHWLKYEVNKNEVM